MPEREELIAEFQKLIDRALAYSNQNPNFGGGYQIAGRENLVESIKQERVAEFQKLIDKDPLLAAQTVVDPLGVLSRFGLFDAADREINQQITRGTPNDLIHFRERVATLGIKGAVEEQRQSLITICVTASWNRVRVQVCVGV